MNLMLYVISFFIGGAGGWIITKWGIRLSLMDHPNKRSSHHQPTPKGGGIGILAAFLICSLYTKISYWFWFPALSISLLGLYTDRFEISPQLRLLIQFTAAFFIIIGIGGLDPGKPNDILLIIFFTIYIAGTGNFYNFMDGINGIAGITGIVGFGLLGGYAISAGENSQWVILAFVLVFACMGFLPFNIPGARVFMGDVGSILLGFVFACMVVAFTRTFSDFVILTCFMFPFYIDELVTMAERIIDKQSLTMPHRRHFYQVLANEAGIEHWKISLGYGISQMAAGLLIWFLILQDLFLGIAGVLCLIVVFFIINMKVKKHYSAWIKPEP
jgi:UDP-N-acetylmuramyl pentapeptide phosphotransferase/UDP-N-acetylglucosamine-1-phosphate transferase